MIVCVCVCVFMSGVLSVSNTSLCRHFPSNQAFLRTQNALATLLPGRVPGPELHTACLDRTYRSLNKWAAASQLSHSPLISLQRVDSVDGGRSAEWQRGHRRLSQAIMLSAAAVIPNVQGYTDLASRARSYAPSFTALSMFKPFGISPSWVRQSHFRTQDIASGNF